MTNQEKQAKLLESLVALNRARLAMVETVLAMESLDLKGLSLLRSDLHSIQGRLMQVCTMNNGSQSWQHSE